MESKIKGGEAQLSKIFSSEFVYIIPPYQRPYAWTDEETNELFDDFYNFYSENNDENYFLGSIVLIKKEGSTRSDVIDGQQRLTTLTILLSILAYKLKDDEFYDDLREFIIEKGKPTQGILAKPRLSLRERDNDFFKKYVQEMRFDELKEVNTDDIQYTEAQKNIKNNSLLLMQRIDEAFSSIEEIKKFVKFLVNQCYLIVVSTTSEDSAFRIFSVMNNRGLSLLPSDIIKADLIGKINDDMEKEDYTHKWEEIEVELTRDGFNDLFSQIRMIKCKEKAKKSLQEEFNKFVLPKLSNDIAIDFIDNTLIPYSQAYYDIKKCEYKSQRNAEQVNDILKWLNKIDNSDWVPVAMLYYKNNSDADSLYYFFKKLERLAAYMRASSWDVNSRIRRYASILSEIESNPTNQNYYSIELSYNEKKNFIDILNSDIYQMVSNKRNYIILRLDTFISDNTASYNYRVLTIEHVLPQTIKYGTEWDRTWINPDDRKYWLHKIGNLVPLSKRKNSEAQNYDFERKKSAYFKSKSGVAAYNLTTEVLSYNEWTPDIVKSRQQKLLNAFKKGWDLT